MSSSGCRDGGGQGANDRGPSEESGLPWGMAVQEPQRGRERTRAPEGGERVADSSILGDDEENSPLKSDRVQRQEPSMLSSSSWSYLFVHACRRDSVVAVSQKSNLEVSLEESRAELVAVRRDHADTVTDLEAQVIGLHNAPVRRLPVNIRPPGNLKWWNCSFKFHQSCSFCFDEAAAEGPFMKILYRVNRTVIWH